MSKMFSKRLLVNFVVRKTMESAKNNRDIKLVTNDKRRNKLVSEANCHTAKHLEKATGKQNE